MSGQIFLRKHSQTILTCLGTLGVIGTAVASIKATPKAIRLLKEAEDEKGEELTKFEIFDIAGPVYIPSILIGVSTIMCIFGLNAVSQRKQASLISAYAVLNSAFEEYRDAVKNIYGEDADDKIKEVTYKDNTSIITPGYEDTQLFYDYSSGRYFESTLKEVHNAEYCLNKKLVTEDATSLNDYYELIGLEPTPTGDDVGWSTPYCYEAYWNIWIDFSHKKTVMDDGLECTIVSFDTEPVVGFDEY